MTGLTLSLSSYMKTKRPKVAVLVPAIGSIVTVTCPKGDAFYRQYDGTLTRWRVNGYLCETVKPPVADWIAKILYDTQQRISSDHKRMSWCARENATHVSLVGVCGATVKASRCKVVGRVPWSEKHIAEEEAANTRRIGRAIA